MVATAEAPLAARLKILLIEELRLCEDLRDQLQQERLLFQLPPCLRLKPPRCARCTAPCAFLAATAPRKTATWGNTSTGKHAFSNSCSPICCPRGTTP